MRIVRKRKYGRFAADAVGVYRGTRRITPTDARRAARFIQMAWRRSRKFRARLRKRARKAPRQRVYNAPSSAIQHRDYVLGTTAQCTTLNRKTLRLEEIKFCFPPTDNDTIGAAPSSTFIVSGTRMCFTAQIVNNDLQIPAQLHVAVIQPKSDQARADSDLKQDWFREGTLSTDKNLTFVDWDGTIANSLYDNRYLCNPLSTNAKNVLFHKKFILHPSGHLAGTPDGTVTSFFDDMQNRNFIHMNKWIRLNKRFEYEDSASSGVRRPLILAVWWDWIRSPNSDSGQYTAERPDMRLSCNFHSYIKRPEAVFRYR